MKVLIFSILLISSYVLADEDKKSNVVYKYKQYEKFDFEELQVEGDASNTWDLSVFSRYERKFKNQLPYKKNFKRELIKSVERIK